MKVIDIDRELSSKSPDYAARYLLLDNHVTPEWTHFFENAYSNTFSAMRRTIEIQGQHVIVQCPLDELQSQIHAINGYCAKADREFEQWLEEQQQKDLEKSKKREDENSNANEVFNKLKF